MRLDDFLACFFPTDTERLFLRGFSPKEIPEPQREPVFGTPVTRKALTEDKQLQTILKTRNRTQGLYFVPNIGGFKEQEITRLNAVFCEIDTISIPSQHDLYDLSPLPPSIRVETKKSVHAYWLLGENGVVPKDWYAAQCGLIDFFKSDAGIKNPNRVMRLPFFNHLSWDGDFHYKRVEIHTFNPDSRFGINEIREAYPFTVQEYAAPSANYGGKFENTIEGIANELRYRISQHPTYKIESDRVHAVCQGVCHNAVYGKTALMVNLRTGAVFCHAGCDYWAIAGAFGLQKPEGKNGAYSPRVVNRTLPRAETGRRLMEHVYGNNR
jgi:hypothetical protein